MNPKLRAILDARRAAGAAPPPASAPDVPARAKSPGLSRYDYAAKDPAALAASTEAFVTRRAEELVRDKAMRPIDARGQAIREAAVLKTGPEDDTGTGRARDARDAGEDVNAGIVARTLGTRALPMMGDRPTPNEKDVEWRTRTAANLESLGDTRGAYEMAKHAWDAPTPEMTAAQAEADGLAKKWVDQINGGLGRIWEGVRSADTDTVTAGTHEVWDGILGYGADSKIHDVVGLDLASPKDEAPTGFQGIATRAVMKTPAMDIGIQGAEALTTTAADVARFAHLDNLADAVERNGMDHATATQLLQIMEDTRPSKTFDELAGLYTLPDGELRAEASIGELRPADIPDTDTAGRIVPSAWRSMLEAKPETRGDPAYAKVWKDIDAGADDTRLEWNLRQVPYDALRTVDPSFGPRAKEVKALAARRTAELASTGGKSTEALASLFSRAMVAKTTNDAGDVVYVESIPGKVMRLAGGLAEGVFEGDVSIEDAVPESRILAAIADKAGADNLARKLREARLPTKAGLDFMAQSGAFDDVLYLAGLDRPTPLRIGDPESVKSWLARVATNVQMPEYQGTGYADFYNRAGGDPTSTVSTGLDVFDQAVGFVLPVDTAVADVGGSVLRRGSMAATAARTAPRGMRALAARAAALPEFVAKGDRDALAAFHQTVEAATIDAIRGGDLPSLASLDSPEFDAVVRAAGVDPAGLRTAVRTRAAENRGRVLAKAKDMLKRGSTPELDALRQDPAYLRRRQELDTLVAADLAPDHPNKLTPENARMALRWEEALALTMADGGTAFVRKGHPEDYFGRMKREVAPPGAQPNPGAFLQGKTQTAADADVPRPLVPTFYSSLRRAVDGIKQEKLTADQLRATLRNTPGVKADEIEWTGLDRFLAEHPKPTKTEVLGWLDEHAVVVEEKRLGVGNTHLQSALDAATREIEAAKAGLPGPTANDILYGEIDIGSLPAEQQAAARRLATAGEAFARAQDAIDANPTQSAVYANYQLPGGSNYREVLFKLPMTPKLSAEEAFLRQMRARYGLPDDATTSATVNRMTLDERDLWRDMDRTVPPSADYHAPHFGNEGRNLLAHARMSDRVGPNGEKLLHVEEVQSDWHQAGREKGYVEGDALAGLVSERDELMAERDRLYPDGQEVIPGLMDDGSGEPVEFWTQEAAWEERGEVIRSPMRVRPTDTRTGNMWRDRHEGRGLVHGDMPPVPIFARILEVEREIDAAQAAIPAAPFSKTWHELVMKRVLREAAEGGYDGVTWTTGVQQVKRYEDATRQAVDEIRWQRGVSEQTVLDRENAAHDAVERAQAELAEAGDDATEAMHDRLADAERALRQAQEMTAAPAGEIEIIGSKNGREVYRETMPPEKVADVLGKGMAAKIAESPDASGSLSGADLTIGGEGMKGFYDKILPEWLNKYTKRWGGRVGEGRISTTAAGVVRVEQVPGGWALRDERGAVTGSVYDSPERAQGVADRINAQHLEPVHYLALTPQMRDALLHEGQPLFQRVGGGVRGSIEPVANSNRVVGFLQRFFADADFDTLLHENAHGARFLYGDDWTNELARHFDHVVDPATGTVSLTRKGEEQTAEAFRWFQRTKMHPDGVVRGLFDQAHVALDRYWFAMRNELAARGLGTRPDAPILPSELAAYFDAQFNPGRRARTAAIRVLDTEVPREPDVVVTTDNPDRAVLAAEPPRAGKRREFARIDTAPDHVRHALGIDVGVAEIDPIELFAKAMAYTTTEKFRTRGWGTEAYRQIGSSRTAVPVSRAARVLRDVAEIRTTALGTKPPEVVKLTAQAGRFDAGEEVLRLTPMQRAGVRTLIDEASRSTLGNVLPDAVRAFDAADPAATLSVREFNQINNTLIDIHAGVAARRSLRAENLVSAPMVTAAIRLMADAAHDREAVRHLEQAMSDWFGVETMERYMGPQVRAAAESVRREMGHLSTDAMATLEAARRGGAVKPAEFLRAAVGGERPVIHPASVDALGSWVGWFKGAIGDVSSEVPAPGSTEPASRAGADVPTTLDTLFDPSSNATLTGIVAVLGQTPHAGVVGLTKEERVAATLLRKIHADHVASGSPSWSATFTQNPQAYHEATDALAALQVGTSRRWRAFREEAEDIVVCLSGSNDRSVLKAMTDDDLKRVYGDFWSGRWSEMFAFLNDKGHIVAGPSFNQSQAMMAALMRLRGRRILASFADRLLELGIAADAERATTLGTAPAASYVDVLGQRGAWGGEVVRARTQRWLTNIVSFNERPVVKGHVDPATGRFLVTEEHNVPNVDITDPLEMEAYTLAHRYLSQLGWQYGKGSFGAAQVLLPDGRELFLPEMLWKYLTTTLEDTAKTGGAFAGTQSGGKLGNAWRALSEAVARGTEMPGWVLGTQLADSELGQVTALQPEQVAMQARRRAAQTAGAVSGAALGTAAFGWPGAPLGAALGREVVPAAIEGAGAVAKNWRRAAGPIGGAAGTLVGGTLGAAMGGLKTAVDGLRVLYPMTLGMARVGLTSGLLVPHPAFFVNNAFGAVFQTYLRTGLSGAAGMLKTLTPWAGEPGMIGRYLCDVAGWNTVANVIPEPRPFIGHDGTIWTYDRLRDASRRGGMDSSFVRSMSTNALADQMREMMGTTYDRMMAHPLATAVGGPLGSVQDALIELASAIDNGNRMGVFIDQLKRGVGAEEAAAIARDAAFDYGNISAWERAAVRPIVMFYSYVRQSVGLFWWTAIHEPSRVLGALRASNGARYQVDDPEYTLNESVDTRLLLYFRQAQEQGHQNQGVAMVSSPMTIDAIPLFADLVAAIGGSQRAQAKVVGHLSPLAQFGLVVGPTGQDLFTGSNVNDYNNVPTWLVSLDRDLTGGLLADVLDLRRMPLSDAAKTEAPGLARYQAGNGRAWWVFRNLIQVPPFGRYIDEVGALDRWAPGGGVGPVSELVQAARVYRENGGDDDLDAFLAGPVRATLGAAGLVDTSKPMGGVWTPDVGDIATSREDVTAAEEGAALFGVKPVVVPRAEVVRAREVVEAERRLKDAERASEKTLGQ